MAGSETDLQAHGECVLFSLPSLKLRFFLFCRRAASTVGDQGGDWPQSPVLVRWHGDRGCRALKLIIRSLVFCALVWGIVKKVTAETTTFAVEVKLD